MRCRMRDDGPGHGDLSRALVRRGRTLLCSATALLTLGTAGAPARADVVRAVVRSQAADVQALSRGPSPALRARGWVQEESPGQLPHRQVRLVIPPGHSVTDLQARVLASEPLSALTGALAGEAAPSSPLAEMTGVGAWHGYQIVFVRLAPCLSGAGGREFASEVEIELHTEPGTEPPLRRQRWNPQLAAQEADEVRAYVDNPEQVQSAAPPAGVAAAGKRGPFRPAAFPDLEGSDVEYVIVTSQALAPAFQALADWKTRRGVPTVVETIESIRASYRQGCDPQETIRIFLQDAYRKWSMRWVLLGGDTDIIPARYLSSSFGLTTPEQIPCDLYFAGLDGNWNKNGNALWGEAPPNISTPDPDQADLLADVYLARAPVTTPAQASAFVQKVIAYETPLDPTYQAKNLFLAEVLFPAAWDTTQTITMDGAQFSQDMIAQRLPSASVVRRYENYTSYPDALPLTGDLTLAELRSGYNLVNHIGHGFRYNMSVGDRSIINTEVDALVSINRYSIVNILNCTSLAFDYSCLGEHFINNPVGGAVAILGASRSAYPLPSREYQDDFYDLLFNQGVWHVGELMARSRLNQTPLAATESAHRWTHYIYNMLGEPETAVFNAQPRPLVVTHAAGVVLGTSAITVAVQDSSLAPVAGARVCLLKGDDDYQVGTTGPDGNVSLSFRAESAGTIQVTVSGRNSRTYLGQIGVGQSAGPYLHFAAATVDDDNAGGTAGNGDGILDAGETVDLLLTLRNDGATTATGVTGGVTVSDSYVTVLSGSLSAALVPAGGTAPASAPVRLRLAAGAPDGHAFEMVLALAGGGSWGDRVRRVVHAPALELVRLEVLDGALGNGNGQPDEGEIFDLRATLKNYGSGRVDGLTATLQTSNMAVQILQGTSSYGSILPLAEGANVALFELQEDIVARNFIDLGLTDSRGRHVVKRFELERPSVPASPTLDASAGPTIVLVRWAPVPDPDLAGYHVYRARGEFGPYTRVTVDYTRRVSSFRDTDLQTSTRYYYYVTAVDSSGNESVASPFASASTNPPQLSGWPIDMMAETSSSPAIGDLDGDHAPEIVVGDARVYAWHGDGQEILDADQDAQTWGVFSTVTGTITGAVALGELDRTPGLEVVACNWADNGVFALDGNGSLLWSRRPANGGTPGFWGSPTAADVDGDGREEVFVVSKDGREYAWHGDGTPLRPANADGTFASLAAWTRSTPAVGNLDLDPQLEIVTVDIAGNLYAWKADGTSLPGFPKSYGVAFFNSPVLGDVNGDGVLEIVAVSQSGSNNLHCLRPNGSELPGFPFTVNMSSAAVSPSPALADFDGDGKLEIIVGSNEYDPAQSRLYVYRYNATLFPGWPQPTHTDSESSPVVADFDGDGKPDIVFGGQDGVLRGWNRNGVELVGFPLVVGDFIRGTPAAGDVDGDGKLDLVLAGWDKRVYVWAFPVAYSSSQAQWPMFQHDTQHTGQFGLRVHDATDAGAQPAPPRRLELAQNRPNPFNPTTEIAFGVPPSSGVAQPVRLQIYDARGHLVRTLVDGPRAPGRYRIDWDGRDDAGRLAATGVYFYRLRVQDERRARRMLLLR